MAKETTNTLIKDIEKRRRFKIVMIYTLAVLGAGGLMALLGFVGKKQSGTQCWKLEIQVEAPDGRKFIDEHMISALADSATTQIVGVPIGEVDIQSIHREVASNSSVSARRLRAFSTPLERVTTLTRMDSPWRCPIWR